MLISNPILRLVQGTRAAQLTCIVSQRMIQDWPVTKSTQEVFMPKILEDRKLPYRSMTPINYPKGVLPPLKYPRRNVEMRGPERIHNQLIYGHCGIIALKGGALQPAHFDSIRIIINHYLDTERFFAIWRVDPPWKAVSKKSMGKKLGGGKAKVHHFETPVKAGRIIIELAGIGEFAEVKHHLHKVAQKLPFYAMPISQEIMDNLKKEKEELDANNINPFEYRNLLRKNFSNSQSQISPKEMIWGGTYY